MEGDNRNQRVPLLKKYDIPVDHLSYEYVDQCSNKKELERIVRILRSGEEGMYPDLIKVAEEKLRKLAPNSRVLRVEQPILTKESLTEEEWKEVEDDLLLWENEMKIMDQSLEFEKKRFDVIGNKNLPDVRKVENTKPKIDKTNVKIETDKKNSRIRSGDYSNWDKYDVDKELLKLDVEEEKKAEESAKKKRELEKKKKEEKNIEIVNPVPAANYTNTEQLVLANQAKDRGNECFKTGDLNNALKYYGVSLKLCPTANAYNNRAMTYIKLKNYENALADCNEVLKLEPNNVKALHRRATAYQNLPNKGNNELALKDLSRIITLEPNNKVAQTDLQTLKRKLQIEDNGRRFRMAIQETYNSKSGDASFPGSDIPVDKLPLTYYGPSTSTFQCEPHSMAHKILLGASFTGRVMCKCNSNSLRQNPLCQRCGELMSRPKPPVKRNKTKPEIVKDKIDNNKKNELLKQNENCTILPKEAEEARPVNDANETKNKEEVNSINEKSKSEQEPKNVEKPNAKFKEHWDNFINSKFSSANKPKPKFVNNTVDDGKTAFITEIFDEEEDLEKEKVQIEEEKIVKETAEDNSENKKEEKNLENECKQCYADDKEKNEKLPESEEKLPELEEKSPKLDEKLPELEEAKLELKEALQEIDEKMQAMEVEKKLPESEDRLPDLEEENCTEAAEKHEKSPHTADSSDNQSLPSTSSQSETRKSKNKKKRRERNTREYKYSYPEPIKVQQASKYLKPTSAEPKVQSESANDIHHEIRPESNVHFKSFVPNRKSISTEDVLKSNSSSNICRDNRFESMDGDGEKILNEINEEGNKENIEKSKDAGGEEVRVAKKIESAYEFIREWESLKKSDETYAKRAEIMKLLKPSDLGKVIGNKLDSEILKNMLECLERHFIETDPKTAIEFLKQFLSVPRFGIVKLFMDNYEKKIIERLVDSAEKKGFTLDQEIKKQLTSG